MKNKKSQYSIWAPIIRNKIKKEEEIKGRKLEKEERSKLIKKEKRKCRVRATYTALIAAIGITAGATTIKYLEAPKDNKTKVEAQTKTDDKRKDFLEKTKADVIITIAPEEEKLEAKDILAEHGYNIDDDKIGCIKSKPQFITINENQEYVDDYKENTEASDYITDNKRIEDMYTLINRDDNTIITTLGRIDDKYVNIDAKQVMVNGKEYFQGENVVDVTKDDQGNEKSQDELKKVYEGLENKYNQIIENQKSNDER
mgnify:CR=1 FL=1